MESPSASPPQRRTFLLVLAGGLAGLLAAASAWPVLRFLAPAAGHGAGERIDLPRSAVQPGAAHFFQFRGKPAVLVQSQSGEYLALSAVCTHLGCIVQWEKEKQSFLCPCHAGHYSSEGVVISGPPPKPLAKIPLMLHRRARNPALMATLPACC